MAERGQDFDWDAGDAAAFTIDLALVSETLTGAAGRWLLADKAGTTLVEKSGAAVVVTESPKEMTVTLDAADTLALAGFHKHQAFVTPSGGSELKVAEGTVSIFEKLAAP